MNTLTITGQHALTLPVSPLAPLDPNARPTVEAVQLLRSELYKNTALVQSQYGGGQNGLLGMLMPPAKYETITPGMLFELPPDRPDKPDLEGEGVEEMKRLYNLELADYNRALQLQVQIKWLMLQAIPRKCIAILQHSLMQFTDVSLAAILAHMVSTYGQIRARDLERNLINIAHSWNPDTDIKTVFNHGTLCRELAAEGGNPITDASYVLILVKFF